MIRQRREFFEYSIFDNGEITRNERTIKPHEVKSRSGKKYLRVDLYINGTRHRLLVHRLVAAAFLCLPSNKFQVDHIDRDTRNNNLTNLEVVDGSINQKRWRRLDKRE